MKKTLKKRNPLARTLANPCFQARVVRNHKLYSRKGRAVHRNNDLDGFFLFLYNFYFSFLFTLLSEGNLYSSLRK